MSDKIIAELLTRSITFKEQPNDGDLMFRAAHRLSEMTDHIEELRRALKIILDEPEAIAANNLERARTALRRV